MRADEGLQPLRIMTVTPPQSAPLTAPPIGRSGSLLLMGRSARRPSPIGRRCPRMRADEGLRCLVKEAPKLVPLFVCPDPLLSQHPLTAPPTGRSGSLFLRGRASSCLHPRKVAPVFLVTSATTLPITASISVSVKVFSRGCKVTLTATDFLPSGMPVPS